jgi:hypothetical protein
VGAYRMRGTGSRASFELRHRLRDNARRGSRSARRDRSKVACTIQQLKTNSQVLLTGRQRWQLARTVIVCATIGGVPLLLLTPNIGLHLLCLARHRTDLSSFKPITALTELLNTSLDLFAFPSKCLRLN